MRPTARLLWYVRGKTGRLGRERSTNSTTGSGYASGSAGAETQSNYYGVTNVFTDRKTGSIPPNISRAEGRVGVPYAASRDKNLHKRENETHYDYYWRMLSDHVEFSGSENKTQVHRMNGDQNSLQSNSGGGNPEASKRAMGDITNKNPMSNGSMSGMQYFDRRLAPIGHEALRENCLKCIRCVFGPDGRVYPPTNFEDAIVGLLFFSENDKSLMVMQRLSQLLASHREKRLSEYIELHKRKPSNIREIEDFAVIAVSSCASGENDHFTRRLGFYHLTNSNGAPLVERDLGFCVLPTPKLIIVKGSNGRMITDRGHVALMKNPRTCLEKWKRGERGYEWYASPSCLD
eukprot:PhM_4_TR15905/c1_g1_i1/m.32473